jgi:hypothetical protein
MTRNDPLAALGKVLVSLQDESTPFTVFLCVHVPIPKCSSLHLEIFYYYSPIFVDLFSNIVFCSPFHFISFYNFYYYCVGTGVGNTFMATFY